MGEEGTRLGGLEVGGGRRCCAWGTVFGFEDKENLRVGTGGPKGIEEETGLHG